MLTHQFDWYILPIANPDGYVETFSGNRFACFQCHINIKHSLNIEFNFREWRVNKNPKFAAKCRKKEDQFDYNKDVDMFVCPAVYLAIRKAKQEKKYKNESNNYLLF